MRRSSVGVSNIQKWFFSEKAFREQLRSWGWIYLFFASFSLLTGLISFGVTLRWFPISDMLRALLLDSLLTLPVMFLPGMLATGVLVLSFVPFFAATLSNVVHILLYHAPISTFAIQSIFETTSNEAREFATDFFSIPNALILMVVFVIPLFLLVKAVRARKRFSRPSLQWCVLALILCIPIAYSAVRKGPRLLASHGVYQFCTTLCRYTDEIRAVDTVRSERQNLSLAPVAFLDGEPAMPRTLCIHRRGISESESSFLVWLQAEHDAETGGHA